MNYAGGKDAAVQTVSEIKQAGGDAIALQADVSNAAVEQLTRVFSKEAGDRGINVNAVSPGPTNTELFTKGKSQEVIIAIGQSGSVQLAPQIC